MATVTNSTTRVPAVEATITEQGILVLAFSNGEKLEMNPTDLSGNIVAQALLHGLKQKLVDAAAISRNTETGRSATPQDKFEAVKEVYDRLLAGEWNKRREGGTSVAGGLLVQALVKLYAGRKTAEQIKEFLEGKTDAEKAALRKAPTVAAIIEELKAAKVKTDGVDTDALLADLDD